MKILTKFVAGFFALTMCISYISPASASTIYGDVNNDGCVDLSDLSLLNMYLRGSVTANSINKKYADVDQNTVIDVNDVKVLKEYVMNSNFTLPYSESGNTYPECNSYTFPSDSSRTYVKYNCLTGIQTTYPLNAASSYSLYSGNIDDREIDSSADARGIVYLEFTKNSGGRSRGTGFIVDNHIIATCAHCIYDGTGFNTNYTIKIMNSDGNSLLRTATAKELHIPNQYKLNSSEKIYYDYGLIYVAENLSSYGKIALGTVSDYFTTTSSELDISGFPDNVSGSYAGVNRYYGTGTVKSTSNNYLLETTAYASGGDSGGPMYISYELNGESFRSAVGIYRGHYVDTNRYSLGVRITTPVLRFYMHNNNIGS